MIEHTLPQPWSNKLPFGIIMKGRISKKCRGAGCLFGEGFTKLFPDGRLSIREGYRFEEPDLLGFPFRKLFVPLMVFEALEEFEVGLDLDFGTWKRVRKNIALSLMHDRKVDKLILGNALWNL